MVIYFGADHRGFELKEVVKQFLKGEGYEVVDMGNSAKDENDDYPDFAKAVAEKVSRDPVLARGILFCGSGSGMEIAANKFRHVRSATGFSADQIYDSRRDDNINVLAIPADFLTENDAKKMVKIFLTTSFRDEERYRRRLEKIADIENAV